MAKYKLEVLKRALGQGAMSSLRLALLMIWEELWCETLVILRLHAKDLDRFPQPDIEGFSARKIKSWQELDERTRARLTRAQEQEGVWWGDIDWFESGLELWVGFLHGEIAALSWLSSPAQRRNFYCPLPENSILRWQMTTFPDFRGLGLQRALGQQVMRAKAQDGAEHFFSSVRIHNIPSQRSLRAMGFESIGIARVYKCTGRRIWSPYADAGC